MIPVVEIKIADWSSAPVSVLSAGPDIVLQPSDTVRLAGDTTIQLVNQDGYAWIGYVHVMDWCNTGVMVNGVLVRPPDTIMVGNADGTLVEVQPAVAEDYVA